MMITLRALPWALLGLLAACGPREASPTPTADVPADLFTESAPAAARPVAAVRSDAKPGDEVVLFGRIGGRARPFVSAQAVFVMVDPELLSCPPDEGCATPWDCCCSPRDEIAARSATVQVVGDDGAPLPVGLDGVGGLHPDAVVTVAGKVRAVDGGLLIDARRIHVR